MSIDELVGAHKVALASWRETIVGNSHSFPDYKAMLNAESALARAGVNVVIAYDGEPHYAFDNDAWLAMDR